MTFTKETAKAAGRKGGKARAQAFTHEYQSRAAKIRAEKLKGTKKLQEWGQLGNSAIRTKYSPEDFAAWGKLGAKAVIAKYGEEHYVMIRLKAAEQRKKKRPSRLERVVLDALKRLGLEHERERVMVFGTEIYTVDIALTLPNGATGGIQVHGEWWHNKPYKRAIDKRRLGHLTQAGWAVLTLWERAITDPEVLVATLQEWYNRSKAAENWIVGDPVAVYNQKGRQANGSEC